jgi:hypothetical protein
MLKSSMNKLSLFGALALTALLSACGQPASSVSKEKVDALMAARHAQALEEEHVEPDGFKFVSNGSDFYVYRNGQPTSTLFLTLGQTYPIEVLFLDDQGGIIDFSAHEPGEYEALVESKDTNKLTWTSTGYFTGNLKAVGRGKNKLRVGLLHDGHLDYDATFDFDVRVSN